MKKIALLFGTLVLLVVVILLWRYWGERYVLAISEDQIVEKLNQKFPFEKNYFFFLNLHFSNPRLSLEEGSDRIRFGCDVHSNIKVDVNHERIPGPLGGTALLSGQLRYEASEGAFFLDRPLVEKLDIAGLPSRYAERVNSAASKMAAEYLTRAPIYRLKSSDVKHAAARLVLKKVVVSNKKLLITLGVGT